MLPAWTQNRELEIKCRENTLQWRLKERDDWKNLVAAVQRDRSRLEQENGSLKEHIAALHTQISGLGAEPVEPCEPFSAATSGAGADQANLNADRRSGSSGRASPGASDLRIRELEAQLRSTRQREDDLRQRLEMAEAEVQKWKVERQADLLAQVHALQSKLNMELEQKWARRRGNRPVRRGSEDMNSYGMLSRLIEVVAPYPEGVGLDETRLLQLAKIAQLEQNDEEELGGGGGRGGDEIEKEAGGE